MGKAQKGDEDQKNKTHKSLRDKLRKKRTEIKKHKKEKSQKKKEYDGEAKKKQFFEKGKKKARDDGIKEHKLLKHLDTFIDIYEDNVEDFYEIFKDMDEGGVIDISDLSDIKMQKCLKKLFKYLPLKKKKMEYKKREKEASKIKLEIVMRELLTRAIENYMENGTEEEEDHESSSEGEEMGEKEKDRKKGEKVIEEKIEEKPDVDPKQKEKQSIKQYSKLELYPERQKMNETGMAGPSISHEQREILAKMFDSQIKEGKHKEHEQKEKKEMDERENDQFQRIFSMASSKKKPKAQRASIDDVPDNLLAEGSAKIGEKQAIDEEQMERYNQIHRPKKLIEEHQQMMKLGKYSEGNKERKPFDRERDIVYGRSKQSMNNGVFFDFKDKMTKPKTSNNFL